MKLISNYLCCRSCKKTTETKYNGLRCPLCNSVDICNNPFIICSSCTHVVYLDGYINTCDNCKTSYDEFGYEIE